MPDDGLLGALAKLNANVERLVQLLAIRQQESAGLRTVVERIDVRTSGLSGAITALQEKSDSTRADVEVLASEQAKLTVWVTQVEQRVDDRDQPQGLVRHALERVSELGERVSALERRAPSATLPRRAPEEERYRTQAAPEASGGQGGRSGPPTAVGRQAGEPDENGQPGGRQEETRPSDLAARVERLEWKQQTLSRIVQRLVDILLGGQGGAPERS